jgi:RHS repeat-associated protein
VGYQQTPVSSGTPLAIQYTRDGAGDLTGVTTNGVLTTQIVDPTTSLPTVVQRTNTGIGSTTSYLWGNSLLGRQSPSDELFFLADAIGTNRAVTSTGGTLSGSAVFDPYGNLISSSGLYSLVFAFAGEQVDSAGLIYLRARTYDPLTGVFLQRDSYRYDPYDPTTLNRYSYAGNNPTNVVDPSGLRQLSAAGV